MSSPKERQAQQFKKAMRTINPAPEGIIDQVAPLPTLAEQIAAAEAEVDRLALRAETHRHDKKALARLLEARTKLGHLRSRQS